jgi:class 3 adenylate cyclase
LTEMNSHTKLVTNEQEEQFGKFLVKLIKYLANEPKLSIDKILKYLHQQYPAYSYSLALQSKLDNRVYAYPQTRVVQKDSNSQSLTAKANLIEKNTVLHMTITMPKQSSDKHTLNKTNLDLIANLFAYWVNIETDKSKLKEHEFNLKRHNLKMEILHEISLSLSQLGSTNEVAEHLLSLLPAILDVRACAVLLVGDKRKLAQAGVIGISSNDIEQIQLKLLKLLDGSPRPKVYHNHRAFKQLGFTEVMLVPIVEKGIFYGVLLLFDRESRQGIIPFSAEDNSLVESIASITGVAIQNSLLYTEVLDGKVEKETLLNSTPVAIIATDTDGKVTAVNQTAYDRLGLTPEHITRHFKWNSLIRGVPNECPLYLRNVHFKVPAGLIYGDINIVPLHAHSKRLKGSLITIQDLSETNRIREIFKRYVSDNVVSMLLEQPERLVLGGEERQVTVLFSDLRRFTIISSKLTAEQTVTILNEYFAFMVNIILKHNGTIDKIVGDGIMAVFGAPISSPEDTENAVLCALEMMKAMSRVHNILRDKKLPLIDMGIGIDSGKVVSGNIGSPQQMDFTIVGNAANTASHVCDKANPAEILITETTYNRLKDKQLFKLTAPILLKNERESTLLYSQTFKRKK